MLVLGRKPGERVYVGDDIEVIVLEVRRGRVKLGFMPRATCQFNGANSTTWRVGFPPWRKLSVPSTSHCRMESSNEEMTCGEGVALLDEDYQGSFAYRAALVTGVRGFHVAHDPGSRADFVQALQQLGAEPGLRGSSGRHHPPNDAGSCELFPRRIGCKYSENRVC